MRIRTFYEPGCGALFILLVITMAQFITLSHSQRLSTLPQHRLPSKIAVIGAGAAGLISAQRLHRDGFSVKVFERGNHVGGVWKYCEEGVLYRSLQTNIPKEIMPFNYQCPFEDDTEKKSFIPHSRVQSYLEKFSATNKLEDLISFSSHVKHVRKDSKADNWVITIEDGDDGRNLREESFDAVLVCNGHYDVPFVPNLKGFENFRGEHLHARDYDDPACHRGKKVLIVGGSMSASDLSSELGKYASSVHVSDRNYNVDLAPSDVGNVVHRHGLKECHSDGSIEHTNGDKVSYDVIIWCTGYLYDMPFLEDEPALTSVLDSKKKRVPNLYQQIVSIEDPTMAFIGLPFSVTPFPCFNWQVRWVSSLYSGRTCLPSKDHMLSWLHRFEEDLTRRCFMERKYHQLSERQWPYYRFLAMSAEGVAPGALENWFDPDVRALRAPEIIDGNDSPKPPSEHTVDEILNSASSRGSNEENEYHEIEEQLAFMLRYIDMQEGIYSDIGPYRPKYPGQADTYRQRKYIVDRGSLGWQVDEGDSQKGGVDSLSCTTSSSTTTSSSPSSSL
jgi:thioredoxin reductase